VWEKNTISHHISDASKPGTFTYSHTSFILWWLIKVIFRYIVHPIPPLYMVTIIFTSKLTILGAAGCLYGVSAVRSPFVHLNYPRLITSLSPCRAEVFRQIFDRPPSRPGVVGSSGLGLKQTGWDIDWIFYIKQLLTVIHTKHIMKQKEKWWDFVHIDNRWQSVERKHFKGWKPSRKPKQIQERTDLSNQKVGFPCCNSFVESSAQFEFNTKPMFEKSGCCQLGVCPDTPMSGMLRTSKNYSWMTMSHVLKCVEHGTHKESSSWCFYLSPVSTTKVCMSTASTLALRHWEQIDIV